MAKPSCVDVARFAVQSVSFGISYKQMDCQAWLEYVINHCIAQLPAAEREAHINYRGSNDMARNACFWFGTRAEAAAKGYIMPGAMLFIHQPGVQPGGYSDGQGDFEHVGMYVGEKALQDKDKNGTARWCNAVHSSQTMQRVAGTILYNKEVSGSWTHVGLFACVDYGVQMSVNDLLNHAAQGDNGAGDFSAAVQGDVGDGGVSLAVQDTAAPAFVSPAIQQYVRVKSGNGNPVRIREKHDPKICKYFANHGAVLPLVGAQKGYFVVKYNNKDRLLATDSGVVCNAQGVPV